MLRLLEQVALRPFQDANQTNTSMTLRHTFCLGAVNLHLVPPTPTGLF